MSLPIRSILPLALMVVVVASSRGDEQKIPLGDVPKAVVDAVKVKFPAAELKEAAKEVEDGKTTYELSLEDKGINVDVAVTAEGKILEIERAVDPQDLPKKVKDAIEAKYPKATVRKAEVMTEVEDGEEETSHEVQIVTAEGKSLEVVVYDEDEVEVKGAEEADEFTADFAAEKADLAATGRNPFFILEPGHQLVLEGGKDRLTMLGAQYQQEIAPGKAMDRAEVVGLDEVVKTQAGEFKGCLKTEETNLLKPNEKESKLYVPGVGLVQEESLTLVRHGKVESGK
jgi:hypothetical protein